MSNNLGQLLRRILEWFASILSMFREWFSQPPDDHPLRYFVPGKVMLHVEHQESLGLTQEQIAADIRTFLEQANDQQQWKQQLVPPKPEDILIFPLRDDQGFLLSLVPVRMSNDKASHDDLVQLLLAIRAGLPGGDSFLRISDNITLNSIAPDWLLGNVHHGAHPPSPGSWPLQADTPQEADWNFRLNDTQKLPFANEEGANVHIAILDTTPTVDFLDESYRRWPGHRLLERLWGNSGKLHLHTDIYAGLELMDNSVVGHRYLMQDHGLFVAGILNSIAPEATLDLFKVFTSYGSASTETIAQGITQILQMFRRDEDKDNWRPLIVNCSFGMSLDDDSLLPQEIQEMITAFQKIFDQLASQEQVLIVASAGNYIERQPQGRPEASYPAAFSRVIGVGALSRAPQNEVASYSNLADDPPDSGYMALGGEAGVGNGVLGIYTTEIPDYAEGCLGRLLRFLTFGYLGWRGPGHLPPNPHGLTIDRIRYRSNTTGWAWWAGTSFAAPIIAGLLANWCSEQVSNGVVITPSSARQALNSMQTTRIPSSKERVIHVKQG